MAKDIAVRQAARLLGVAIAEAEAAGYRVTWPANAAGLAAIGVSETGRVVQPNTELRQITEAPDHNASPEETSLPVSRGRRKN